MKTFSARFAICLLAASTGCVDDDDATRTQAITTESGACKVVYETTGWDGGFSGNLVVTNKGAARSQWRVEWRFPGTQRLGSMWNASPSQRGAQVTARNVGWNGALGSGATVSFGFNGSLVGSNPVPIEFSLDGVSCGDGDGGGDGGDGGGGGSGACESETWQAGTSYGIGDVVYYAADGGYYVAEHANPGYDPVISTWFWEPYACEGGDDDDDDDDDADDDDSGDATGFASLVNSSTFDAMFPARNPFYTHAGLVAATASFPGFAATGDVATRKREAAAFLANVAHETGDLVYIEEIAQGEYCAPSAACPCAPGKRYFGRGPIQLSWNYNYCAAGAALGLPLQSNPDLVAQDATVAWQTGLWFWNTQTGAGSMTAHDAMTQDRGFGKTIRTINGALECNGGNPGQVQSRIDDYRRFCEMLGVDPGANLGC